jgi:hypothetical protein
MTTSIITTYVVIMDIGLSEKRGNVFRVRNFLELHLCRQN